MYSKVNYAIVGFFVLLFTLLAIGFAFWLAQYGFDRDNDEYYLYFKEPVDGLNINSSVMLNGVEVGKVSSIKIDTKNIERILVKIQLQKGTPIVKGMYALLKLQGITGLSYVQIEGGKQGNPLLKTSDGKIPIIPTKSSLIFQISHNAPEIFKKLQHSADTLNKILSKHNQEQISKILDNTLKTTAKAPNIEEHILTLLDTLQYTLKKFNQNSDEVTNSVTNLTLVLNKKLPTLMNNVNEASKNINQVAKGINKRLRDGEYDLRKIIHPIQIDIRELSYNYQELSQDLKRLSRHPSSILFGASKPPKGPGE